MRATEPGQSALLALDVIDILNARGIAYAIIGAFAASFYGVVRASVDADALISLQPGQANVNGLIDELQRVGLKCTYRKGEADDPIGAVINIEDEVHNRVDLLMNIHGMAEALFSRTIEAEFMQARIRVIGLEDFIAMKIFAGGPKDLSDVASVLKASRERVNRPLLDALARAYGEDAARTLQTLLQAVPSSSVRPPDGVSSI